MICNAYSLVFRKVVTEKKCVKFMFARKLIKIWNYHSCNAEKMCSVFCVWGAPEYVMSCVFFLVSAGACWARCELNLK